MNNSPLPTPADRFTALSIQLSEGAEAWRSGERGPWLPAPLVAMIVAWIGEIAEALRSLAALLRDGKLNLQPASAPRQSESRPASRPTQRPSHPARRPTRAANRQTRQNPEMADQPETAPRPEWARRPAAPSGERASAPQTIPHPPWTRPKNGSQQARALARP